MSGYTGLEYIKGYQRPMYNNTNTLGWKKAIRNKMRENNRDE